MILDKDGVLHRSTSLPNYESGEFYIQNDYRDGPMCIGINALYGGDIIQLSSPSYVTQTPLIIGSDPLSIRPFEKVAVGFMKNATAGTMFVDDTMTGKVEVCSSVAFSSAMPSSNVLRRVYSLTCPRSTSCIWGRSIALPQIMRKDNG